MSLLTLHEAALRIREILLCKGYDTVDRCPTIEISLDHGETPTHFEIRFYCRDSFADGGEFLNFKIDMEGCIQKPIGLFSREERELRLLIAKTVNNKETAAKMRSLAAQAWVAEFERQLEGMRAALPAPAEAAE